ncbi:MAG: DNA topoisomerase 1 [Planctomycetes bacterium ADurb.Bin126]|nr:MAG: DNA topoisomerase 1 [Planctomycetes bacterium ADurb.Bin126]HOD83537.1 type I DNA topoisomerase [Phycisphaerae bacterium]HQL73443.1 type I DNA topoisomerase [Phycisphaerae bacterium]
MAKTTKKSTPSRRAKPAAGDAGDAPAPGGGKKLVVVESPAKAKTINRYLGRDYVVKASMGHVRDLPAKAIGVDLDNDFQPTYEPLSDRRKVLAELKKAAKSAAEIFLATDLDREGEAIAWHLAESLGVPRSRMRRVIFNEITAPAIRQAFAQPRDIDMNKVNAQQARRILDRIVGYQLSPLLWRKVARGLSAGRVQSVAVRLIVDREREIEAFMPEEYWRIGAIFTPDLARAGEIAVQWEQFLARQDPSGNGPTRDAQQQFLADRAALRAELASWDGKRFECDNDQMALEVIQALGITVRDVRRGEDAKAKGPARSLVAVSTAVGESAVSFRVAALRQRDSRSRPPAPFTTAALQQAASVQLRFAASRTMRVAQQLYEGVEIPGEGGVGLITYMRTDSTHLSQEALSQVRELIGREFGPKYVPEKPNFFAAGERAQEAHEAIRPTDANRRPEDVRDALSDEQFRLYQLIWSRFVACQMPPAVWKVTEADITADTPAGKQAVFKAIGRHLQFDGFFRVAGVPRGGEPILPPLNEGQPMAPVEVAPTQHFTQPPPRYTEASLVKALEADGIGRPSTYASIIQTIQDRQYVELQDRSFRPTDLGAVVTDKLVKHFPTLFDVRFTARMEDRLDRVEEADADWVAVLRDFYDPFHKDLERAMEEMVHAKAESQPSEYTCDTCGRPMVYRFSKGGRYLACSGYPECKQTNPIDEEGRKVERKEVDVPCPTCGKPMVLRRSRWGPFLGCSDYPECKTTLRCDSQGVPLKVVKPEDVHETCPDCGAPMNVRFKFRRAFLGCSRYPQCKTTAGVPEGIEIEPPPRVEPKQAGVNCPKCGKPMLIRIGKRGEFIACSGFPKCRNAMNLDKLDDLRKQQADKAK